MGSVSLIPLRGSENEMRRSVAAFTADPLSVSGSGPCGQGWGGPGWMPAFTSLISLRAPLVPPLGFWGALCLALGTAAADFSASTVTGWSLLLSRSTYRIWVSVLPTAPPSCLSIGVILALGHRQLPLGSLPVQTPSCSVCLV